MPEALSTSDRMVLITALYLLGDRHPGLGYDPLWQWIANEIAPMPKGSHGPWREGGDDIATCARRCQGLADGV